MNIVFVTETFPPEVNGVAMTLQRIVTGLAASGEAVTVVRPRQRSDRRNSRHPTHLHEQLAGAIPHLAEVGGPLPAEERLRGSFTPAPFGDPNEWTDEADGNGRKGYREVLVPGVALPRYEGLMMGLPVSGRLGRRWAGERPDVVHIATEGPLGWAALAAAGKLGIPVSSSFHTNFHQYGDHYGYGAFKEIAMAYLRSFHNQTALTMVPTRQMREVLEEDGFRNVAVVSRGVDTELFAPERRSEELRRSWGVGPQDPVALYVGRLAKEKNIALAVDAFLAIRERQPRAHLVLVGDGPERAALQVRHPEFHFAGMRRGEDLAAHYASGDLFLFPSITETFGNVVTEALGSGLVVVTYDYAAGREYVRHGENGVLARFDDPAAFCTAAREIARRPADWPAMRAAARAAALLATWDSIVKRFRALLAAVVANRTELECGI